MYFYICIYMVFEFPLLFPNENKRRNLLSPTDPFLSTYLNL